MISSKAKNCRMEIAFFNDYCSDIGRGKESIGLPAQPCSHVVTGSMSARLLHLKTHTMCEQTNKQETKEMQHLAFIQYVSRNKKCFCFAKEIWKSYSISGCQCFASTS